jgi:hypothetical protein
VPIKYWSWASWDRVAGTIDSVPPLFRDPVLVTYIDQDDNELAVSTDVGLLPRVGENIRIGKQPYLVERVGYDMPQTAIERVWVVCRPI